MPILMNTCLHCQDTTMLQDLCASCAEKALRIRETDPQQLVDIYNSLKKSKNPVMGLLVDQLLDECIEEAELLRQDPTDRMFNPRG